MKSFSIIRKGFDFVLPLAACSFFGVLVAQEPRREQDKNAAPTPRATNQRPGDKDQPERGRNTAPANPAREGERGTRPEGGRPEAGPDAKNRFLNELNLSKDERAKVESILAAREEKMREVQQSTMKAIRDTIGEEKFQTFMKNSANPNKRAGPANPPREGDRGARPEAGKPEAGRPEGERKAGPANPPREGDKRPEAGKPEGDRKANPPREGDRGARPEAGKPEAGRPEGERKAGPANPPRDGDKRPEAGKPEGDRKANPPREGDRRGPGVGPEARERMLNDLNLSKDVRAKVEGIMNTQQEKIKDVIAKGREANGDREKIMAEVRELQQNMAKSLKEAMGEEKFKAFMKNAPMLFNRGAGPDGSQPGKGAPRQKQ
jgi:Spy/CpxP family protein refolding chaperone